jgi:hypothetical protein
VFEYFDVYVWVLLKIYPSFSTFRFVISSILGKSVRYFVGNNVFLAKFMAFVGWTGEIAIQHTWIVMNTVFTGGNMYVFDDFVIGDSCGCTTKEK